MPLKAMILCALMLSPSLPVWSEDRPRLAVAELQVQEGSRIAEILSSYFIDAIVLNLRIDGGYELAKAGLAVSHPGSEPAAICESLDADYLLYGSASQQDEAISFSLTLYERQSAKEVLSLSTSIDSVLDTFDAADSLALSFLEGFTGRRTRFGSLEIALDRPGSTAVVELNGERLGALPASWERIVARSYPLKVYQSRGSGEVLVYSRDIEITEGEALRLRVPVPLYLPDEAAAFREADDAARAAILDPSLSPEAGRLLALAVERASVIGDPAAREYLASKYRRLERAVALAGEAEPRADGERTFLADHKLSMGFTAPMFALSLRNLEALSASRAPELSPIVDGRADEWAGLPPLPLPAPQGGEKQALSRASLASDGLRVYLLLEFLSVEAAMNHVVDLQVIDGSGGYFNRGSTMQYRIRSIPDRNLELWCRPDQSATWKKKSETRMKRSMSATLVEISFPIEAIGSYWIGAFTLRLNRMQAVGDWVWIGMSASKNFVLMDPAKEYAR